MRIGNSNTIFTGVTGAVASDLLNNKVFAVKADGTFIIKVLDDSLDFGTDKIKESYEFDKSMYNSQFKESFLYERKLQNRNQVCPGCLRAQKR